FEMEVGTFMAPPALDPQDSLDGLSAIGETSLSNTAPVSELVTQLTTYHQGYGLPGKPAPLLLESGWTDSILPPAQSLRIYNAVRAQGGQVALQLGDLGHLPASNKANTNRAFNMQGARFFAARLRHVGNAPRNYSVSAFTLTCPTAEPGGGPYTARSWAALHPHRLDFGSPAPPALPSARGGPEPAHPRRQGRSLQDRARRERAQQRHLHHHQLRHDRAGDADDHGHHPRPRPLRRARCPPVGRDARRTAAPGRPRRVSTDRRSTGLRRISAARRRLPVRPRGHRRARAARPRRPLLPPQRRRRQRRSERPADIAA